MSDHSGPKSSGSSRADSFIAKAANVVFMVAVVVLLFGYVRREWGSESTVVSPPPPIERHVTNWEEYARSGHLMGASTAPVVIVEFADFECPACRQLANGGLRAIRAEFPDTVAVVFRHMPLPYHRLAYSTARAGECAAAQGAFEKFHDVIYRHQDSLGIRAIADFAREAGVSDLQRYDRCIQETALVPVIEADIAAAHEIEVRATPTLLINGTMVTGAIDSASLATFVRAAIADLNE
ncbi:MAG: thioredoxin domain-containing protein [Gemmatimonadota bacterium]